MSILGGTTGSGMADTTTILAARKVVDMSNDISLLEDEKISLTKFLSKLPKKPAFQNSISWMVDELAPKSTTLAEALDNSETDWDVADGTIFRKNDIIKVAETGETAVVSSVSSNTVTVAARSWGTVAATAAANGGLVLNLGPAFSQGAHLRTSDSDGTPLAKRQLEIAKTNYTQIFRDAVALTRTEMQSKLYGGPDRPYQRMKKAIEHVRNINLVAYHGEKAQSGTRNTAGGIIEFVASANTMSTASLTEAQFNSDLKTVMRYGSDSKVLFCSRAVAGIISEWAQSVQRSSAGDNEFGVSITKYISPHGEISIVPDHALEGASYYDKYAVLMDMKDVKLRPLQDTVLLVDRHLPDVDGVIDEYLTETSFEWGSPNKHGLWNSITN